MQLVMWDQDSNYLYQLEKTICMLSGSYSMYIEFIIIHNIEDLQHLTQSKVISPERSLFVFNEVYVREVFETSCSFLQYYLQNQQWAMMSEGLYNEEWKVVVQTYYTKQDIPIETFNYRLIHKYQDTLEIYQQLTNIFIETIDQEIISKKTNTSFITIYKPYGDYSISKIVQDQMKALHFSLKNKKILLIHYDSFFHDDIKANHNLSYIYMQIRKGKTNLSMIFNEIVQRPHQNIHVLEGVLNMRDHDFLTENENEKWISWLKDKSGYDIVIFNLNGIHLSKSIQDIIFQSDHTFLHSEDEVVQKSVREQIDTKWYVIENKDMSVLGISIEKILMNKEVEY